MAKPMPRPPPVMIAVDPVNWAMVCPLAFACLSGRRGRRTFRQQIEVSSNFHEVSERIHFNGIGIEFGDE